MKFSGKVVNLNLNLKPELFKRGIIFEKARYFIKFVDFYALICYQLESFK